MSGIDNVKVGSAYSGHVGWDTAKANALLIATAPDLLKAAKIGLRYIESEMGSDTTERDFVLTAIKKAEGTL
jgi:hypothetical protein